MCKTKSTSLFLLPRMQQHGEGHTGAHVRSDAVHIRRYIPLHKPTISTRGTLPINVLNMSVGWWCNPPTPSRPDTTGAHLSVGYRQAMLWVRAN